MLTEQDFRPSLVAGSPTQNPRVWLSTNNTLTLGEKSSQFGFGPNDLLKQAANGKLRSWASRLIVGETAWSGGEITPKFWEACRGSKVQDWRYGYFEIIVEGRFAVRAEKVRFHLRDLRTLFPETFAHHRRLLARKKPPPTETVPSRDSRVAKGGRRMSASWPQWVAEVVAYMHENGIPPGTGAGGVDVVLNTVADRLATRGLDGPARTTSQETMRAILLRLREAESS